MIRTNLSTRPFYNEGPIRFWLLAVTVAVIFVTVFNVSRVIRYSRSDTTLATQASQDETRAANLLARAAGLRATIDSRQIDRASTEARLANDLIDRRTFSWTELLNLFEKTLPDEVRIAAVRPKLDPKVGIVLTVSLVARNVDDANLFMDHLDATGAFSGLLKVEEHFDDQGQLEATLESVYSPQGAPPETGAKRQ